MRMFFRYLARRLLQAGFSVLAIIVLGFALLHLAPGDPVDVLAGEFGAASPEYLAQLRREFGLDRAALDPIADLSRKRRCSSISASRTATTRRCWI